MTEKTQETIIAKYVKSSGVMVTLDLPGEGEKAIPCDFHALKIVRGGDKVIAGKEYSWLISTDAKGTRAICNVGPAAPEDQIKTAKEILQENRDTLKKEKAKEAPAPAPAKTEKEINLEKAAEESRQRIKENGDYARQLAAEKAEKDKQAQGGIEMICAETKKRAAETQKPVPVSDTVIEAEIVKESAVVPAQTASVQHIESSQKRQFSEDEVNLIKSTVAKDCTNTEFKFLMYLASEYNLDPIRRQIWCIKYGDAPATIFTGRDGFLQIAHRSGQFDGMKSWVEYAKDADGNDDYSRPLKGHCTVWRKDMSRPFETEVLFQEYVIPQQPGKKPTLWQTKPSVMILKVAESVCLRKVFAVTGLYSPEEMGQ